jgi:hypothetical protein
VSSLDMFKLQSFVNDKVFPLVKNASIEETSADIVIGIESNMFN